MKVLSWLLRTAPAIDDRSEGNRLIRAAVLLSELLQVEPSDFLDRLSGPRLPGRETLSSGVGIERSSLNVSVCVALLGERNQS
jgi:hypothetical protein